MQRLGKREIHERVCFLVLSVIFFVSTIFSMLPVGGGTAQSYLRMPNASHIGQQLLSTCPSSRSNYLALARKASRAETSNYQRNCVGPFAFIPNVTVAATLRAKRLRGSQLE